MTSPPPAGDSWLGQRAAGWEMKSFTALSPRLGSSQSPECVLPWQGVLGMRRSPLADVAVGGVRRLLAKTREVARARESSLDPPLPPPGLGGCLGWRGCSSGPARRSRPAAGRAAHPGHTELLGAAPPPRYFPSREELPTPVPCPNCPCGALVAFYHSQGFGAGRRAAPSHGSPHIPNRLHAHGRADLLLNCFFFFFFRN